MPKKADTYTTWLGDELRLALKPLKSFVSIVEQFEGEKVDPALVKKVGTVLLTLYDNTESRMEEILSFTEKRLGHIRLIAARRSYPDYRGGELLSAELIADYDDEGPDPEDLPQILDFRDSEY